jgi:hypothetical protein
MTLWDCIVFGFPVHISRPIFPCTRMFSHLCICVYNRVLAVREIVLLTVSLLSRASYHRNSIFISYERGAQPGIRYHSDS